MSFCVVIVKFKVSQMYEMVNVDTGIPCLYVSWFILVVNVKCKFSQKIHVHMTTFVNCGLLNNVEWTTLVRYNITKRTAKHK